MSLERDEIVIAGGYRTAFGKYGGKLKEWSSVDIGARLLSQAYAKLGLSAHRVDLLVCGTAFQAEVANHTNIAGRQILLQAGLPASTVSLTVDRASCTGMAAVIVGYQAIRAGEADTVIVIGAEALGHAPFLLPPALRWGRTRGAFSARDPLFPMRFPARPGSIIEDVDAEARAFGVDREDMDAWAQESQQRYEAARAAGFFAGEILPIALGDAEEFAEDEAPKPWSTLEKLRTLPTVHGSNLITAGNAPGMETGAAMVVLMRAQTARERGVQPLASITATRSVAGELSAPLSQSARAISALLRRTGLTLEAVELLDIEEDFAAVVPISARVFEQDWGSAAARTFARTNVSGGAIAMGHPIGASGVRQVLTLARELRHRQASLGVAAVAGGLAQGDAVLLRAV